MRPTGCGAGLGVAQAAGGQLAAQAILGVERRHGGEPAVDLARHGERGAREGADAQPRGGVEAMDRVGARGGQGHAVAGHGVLERGEPVRVAAALAQQAGALAQRIARRPPRRRHARDAAPSPAGRGSAGARRARRGTGGRAAASARRPRHAGRARSGSRPAGRRSARPGAAGRLRSAAGSSPVPMASRPSGVSSVAATAQAAASGSSPRARRQTSSRRARRRPRPGARKDSASRRLVLPAPLAPTSTTGSGPQSRRSWR